MADYYISSLAPGGGTGTIGNPFTFAEGIAFINLGSPWADGDTMWVKADGIYNFTAAQTISNLGGLNNYSKLVGYGVTPGDNIRAVLRRSSGAGSYVLSCTVAYWLIKNFEINGNALAGGLTKNSGITENCSFHHCGGIGFTSASRNEVVIKCESYNNSSTGFHFAKIATRCIAYNNGLNGFYGIESVSHSIAKANLNGFNACAYVDSCISDENTTYGVAVNAGDIVINTAISNQPVTGIGLYYIDGATQSAVAKNINIFNCITNSNYPSEVDILTALDPQHVNTAIRDYRRTGENLSGKGSGIVEAVNYELSIGVSPNRIGLYDQPLFAGITGLSISAEGCLLASWSPGSGMAYYNIYIKAGTATGLFDEANLCMKVKAGLTSQKIKTLPDGVTLLDYSTTYYVGIRASNGIGIEDTNTVSMSAIASDNINVLVSAIKAKTDNLPPDPASQASLDLVAVLVDDTQAISIAGLG